MITYFSIEEVVEQAIRKWLHTEELS